MSDAKFGSWSTEASAVRVEYSLVVIEEIRRVVTEGFQKLSRGGIETGGVLYGTYEGQTVRVLAIRAIQCEHARGPAFMLSDKDRAALTEALERDRKDPHLEGFVPVGWFVSHTRGDIRLTDSDLEVYTEYFSAPWQVTMVVRPGRAGSMRAGFFVREVDGSVNSQQSYLEFDFPDRLAGILDRPARTDRPGGERRNQVRVEEPAAPTPRREAGFPAAAQEPPQFLPAPPPQKRWHWLLLWALGVGGLAALGVQYFASQPGPQPISLTLLEREGQLQIEWNPAARPVAGAIRGTLAIVDGNETQSVSLTRADLVAGKFTYQRKSGDIEVRLSVQDAGGDSTQEASRFLGQPPVRSDPEELRTLENRRAELEAEIARLQSENAAQANRIQQLERTLRILQTRLGSK